MCMFQHDDINEFMLIRDDEVALLSHLKYQYQYLHDDRGDPLIDDHGDYIIDTSVSIPSERVSLPEWNRFHCANIMDTVDNHIINNYRDVFGIDHQMINMKITHYKAEICCMYRDNTYQGCIWLITSDLHPEYIALYGIRSSIVNTLTSVKGVAREILSHIKMKYEGYTLVVPWPLYPMNILLEKMGFVRHDTCEDTPERRFLRPITTTHNYYTY